MTPALEVTRLSKRFGGLPATKDVSLTVMPGERRLIIGPNGERVRRQMKNSASANTISVNQ